MSSVIVVDDLISTGTPLGRRYPAIGQSWRRACSEVVPFYAFHADVRRILYTTKLSRP